jgi:hypothetical protein
MPGDAPLSLRIGRRTYRVATLAEASATYCAARADSGLGASEFPAGRISTRDGETLHVSYNGRVWRSARPGADLLFDPARPPASG